MMDATFWHERWASNNIGFHEAEANPLLVEYFKQLKIPVEGRVFLPLCGKTRDIAWLVSQGLRVVGSELSEMAVQQLFDELELVPAITDEYEGLALYSAEGIDIWVGDIFKLDRHLLGGVDGIYDRGALVALPENIREQYSKHLAQISDRAAQLLISYRYDQRLMAGPPFSISAEEVNRHYSCGYQPRLLHSGPMEGGLKGLDDVELQVWVISTDGNMAAPCK